MAISTAVEEKDGLVALVLHASQLLYENATQGRGVAVMRLTAHIHDMHVGQGCTAIAILSVPLKSSFTSQRLTNNNKTKAFLVSHSETYGGNRMPLLFYCTHERNRKEVGAF